MEIDPYVLDVLLPDLVGHDRHPTGLSKRAVQAALERLETRRLVTIERGGITSPGRYVVHRPWSLHG